MLVVLDDGHGAGLDGDGWIGPGRLAQNCELQLLFARRDSPRRIELLHANGELLRGSKFELLRCTFRVVLRRSECIVLCGSVCLLLRRTNRVVLRGPAEQLLRRAEHVVLRSAIDELLRRAFRLVLRGAFGIVLCGTVCIVLRGPIDVVLRRSVHELLRAAGELLLFTDHVLLHVLTLRPPSKLEFAMACTTKSQLGTRIAFGIVAFLFCVQATVAQAQVIYVEPPRPILVPWYPMQPAPPQQQPQQQPQNQSRTSNYGTPNDNTVKTVVIERYYLDHLSDGRIIAPLGEKRTVYAAPGKVIYREYYLPKAAQVPSSSTEANRSRDEEMKPLPKEKEEDITPPLPQKPKPLNLQQPIEQPKAPDANGNGTEKAPAKMEPAKRYD